MTNNSPISSVTLKSVNVPILMPLMHQKIVKNGCTAKSKKENYLAEGFIEATRDRV